MISVIAAVLLAVDGAGVAAPVTPPPPPPPAPAPAEALAELGDTKAAPKPGDECFSVHVTRLEGRDVKDKDFIAAVRHEAARSEMYVLEVDPSRHEELFHGAFTDHDLGASVRVYVTEGADGLLASTQGAGAVDFGRPDPPLLRASLLTQVRRLAGQAASTDALEVTRVESPPGPPGTPTDPDPPLKFKNAAPLRFHGATWGFFTAQVRRADGKELKTPTALSLTLATSDAPFATAGGVKTTLSIRPAWAAPEEAANLLARLGRLRTLAFPDDQARVKVGPAR